MSFHRHGRYTTPIRQLVAPDSCLAYHGCATSITLRPRPIGVSCVSASSSTRPSGTQGGVSLSLAGTPHSNPERQVNVASPNSARRGCESAIGFLIRCLEIDGTLLLGMCRPCHPSRASGRAAASRRRGGAAVRHRRDSRVLGYHAVARPEDSDRGAHSRPSATRHDAIPIRRRRIGQSTEVPWASVKLADMITRSDAKESNVAPLRLRRPCD